MATEKRIGRVHTLENTVGDRTGEASDRPRQIQLMMDGYIESP